MEPQQTGEEVNAFGDVGNVPGTCTQLLHPLFSSHSQLLVSNERAGPREAVEFPRGLQPEAEQECGTVDLSDGC